MSLGSFVAGRFAMTYDPVGTPPAVDMGLTKKGYKVSLTYGKQLVNESDGFARQAIEAILQGVTNFFVDCEFLERKQAVLAALLPYQETAPLATGATYIGPGIVGRRDTDQCGVGIWTAATGTPAAASGPASMTATNLVVAEDFPLEFVMNSELMTFPMRFRVYPYQDGADAGKVKYVTLT